MASASVMLVQPKGELWERIRVELNENVNTRDQDLAAIKEWLRKQPHLPDEWGVNSIIDYQPKRRYYGNNQEGNYKKTAP
ncbi:hypothetical protein B5X24_HaOG208445 [Helicoverpa armigera]|uniref:Uncharacterized protein n=1 Tax=Helicoverpa armigera TaxID=29058 RepID=A0A2W1BK41_HELAM|nr:hypothetical protein B5X24_HaOG208445 [Helicoverpa armigera]